MVTENDWEFVSNQVNGHYQYKRKRDLTRGEIYDYLTKHGVTIYSNSGAKGKTDRFATTPVSNIVNYDYGGRGSYMNAQYIVVDRHLRGSMEGTTITDTKFNYHNALNGLSDYIGELESKETMAAGRVQTNCKQVLGAIRMIEFVRDISAVGRKRIAMTENPHSERFQYLELK